MELDVYTRTKIRAEFMLTHQLSLNHLVQYCVNKAAFLNPHFPPPQRSAEGIKIFNDILVLHIHIVVNVFSFPTPLRELIRDGMRTVLNSIVYGSDAVSDQLRARVHIQMSRPFSDAILRAFLACRHLSKLNPDELSLSPPTIPAKTSKKEMIDQLNTFDSLNNLQSLLTAMNFEEISEGNVQDLKVEIARVTALTRLELQPDSAQEETDQGPSASPTRAQEITRSALQEVDYWTSVGEAQLGRPVPSHRVPSGMKPAVSLGQEKTEGPNKGGKITDKQKAKQQAETKKKRASRLLGKVFNMFYRNNWKIYNQKGI